MTEPLKILSLNQRRILTLQGSQPSTGTFFHNSNLQAMKKNHFSLQKRGLDDEIKFPYFPYRDDNRLLLMAISRMVEDYIWV